MPITDVARTRPPDAQRLELRDWLSPLTATGIVAVIAFWSAVVAWPLDWQLADSRFWRPIMWVFAVAAIGLAVYGNTGPDSRKQSMAYVAPISAVLAVVLVLVASGSGNLGLGFEQRFPIAVGGTALGALLLGVTRYSTIRAAASLAAVVLIIGVLTFPGGRDAVGEDNVATIVGWMAVLIGANGVAEAVVQATNPNAAGDRDKG
jgi:hypothetical protein